MVSRRLLPMLFVPLLALARPASANNYIVSQMYHQFGTKAGNGWRATCSPPCGQFMTYGPYDIFQPSEDLIAITSIYPSPAAGQTLKWTVDVLESSNNQVLGAETFAKTTGGGLFNAVIPFRVPSGYNNVQVRTRHLGGGQLEQCGLLHVLTESQNKIYDYNPSIELRPYHEVGTSAAVGGEIGWLVDPTLPPCQNGACRSNFLSYGPYGDLPPVTRVMVAAFRLGLIYEPSPPPAPGEDPDIATIDVTAWNGTTDYILQQRTLRRSDFKGPLQTVNVFAIPFVRRYGDIRYQYRVRWYGKGELFQGHIKIYDPGDSGCIEYNLGNF